MDKILNLVPRCGYNPDGIKNIWLLDFEDFQGYVYPGLENYDKSHVSGIYAVGPLVPIAAPNMVAKYSSTGSYVHTLETFIPALTHSLAEQLNIAIRRRYVVIYKTNKGQFYTFGDEAGAAVSYANQTAEGVGSLVTITAQSIHPLYELDSTAMDNIMAPARFVWPTNPAYYLCSGGGIQYTTLMLKVDSLDRALDADGKLVSVSGRPQAVAALSGFPPSGPYEVVQEYSAIQSYIEGAATFRYNPESCPI